MKKYLTKENIINLLGLLSFIIAFLISSERIDVNSDFYFYLTLIGGIIGYFTNGGKK